MNDTANKTSKEAFAFYRRWTKAFLDADLKLPKSAKKATLWAYCSAMAAKGTNGLGCFASDAVIAKELQIYHRETVAKYRKLALDLGWFVWNGERRGRAKVLDISIPDGPRDDEYRHVPTVAESDGKTDEVVSRPKRPKPVPRPWDDPDYVDPWAVDC